MLSKHLKYIISIRTVMCHISKQPLLSGKQEFLHQNISSDYYFDSIQESCFQFCLPIFRGNNCYLHKFCRHFAITYPIPIPSLSRPAYIYSLLSALSIQTIALKHYQRQNGLKTQISSPVKALHHLKVQMKRAAFSKVKWRGYFIELSVQ